jgi:hypothetical protein
MRPERIPACQQQPVPFEDGQSVHQHAHAAAGLDLGGGHVTAALDGDPITTDGGRRWRPGDTVCLRPAGGRGSAFPGR